MHIGLVLLGTVISLLLGVGVKFALEKWGDANQYDISWTEFGIAAAFILVVLAPTMDWIGTKVAFHNQVTYHENWGGFEVSVDKQVYACHESDSQGGSTGGCTRTYDADSYTVQVPYQVCETVGSGKNQHQECHTEYRTETRWRQVPYTDTETDWIIHTTLGDFTVGANWLPNNPQLHRIEPEYDSPDSLPSDYMDYTGTPQFWLQAQARINAGDPGPVATRHDYANYILASQTTILHQYNDSIDQYLKAKQLPALSKNPIYDFYRDSQVYFVGVNPPVGNWQFELQQLNGALGSTLQGNLYLVVVNADQISNPDNYTGALTAYWEGPAFGKDAISKNAIVVVVGTKDGQTVAWARAKTGMPEGNEMMLLELQNSLVGTALTPQALVGHPKASISSANGKYVVTLTHSNGAIEKVLWGDHPFARVCMTCTSAADKGKGGVGYTYLKSQIKPTGSQKFWIVFFTGLASALVWGVCIALYSNFKNR